MPLFERYYEYVFMGNVLIGFACMKNSVPVAPN